MHFTKINKVWPFNYNNYYGYTNKYIFNRAIIGYFLEISNDGSIKASYNFVRSGKFVSVIILLLLLPYRPR